MCKDVCCWMIYGKKIGFQGFGSQFIAKSKQWNKTWNKKNVSKIKNRFWGKYLKNIKDEIVDEIDVKCKEFATQAKQTLEI